MNELILSLRNFSLRIAILLMFVLTLVIGLWGIIGGGSMKITGVVGAVTIALVYITFAVHAIDNDDKAVKVSYVMLAAYAVSLLNALMNWGDYPDFAGMIFSGDSVEDWAYGVAQASAPYSLLANVLIAGALIWGIRDVNKKFTIAWIVALIGQGVTCIGAFVLFSGSYDFGVYTSINNIGSVFGGIMIVILLFTGGRAKQQTAQTLRPSAEMTAQPQPPAAPSAGQPGRMEMLVRLKELLDSGVLTQEEFDEEKRKILNG